MQSYRSILFDELVLSDCLYEHRAKIEGTSRYRLDLIISALAKQYGVTERLKAENPLEWVRQRNACKAWAEGIVLTELISD